MNIELEQIWRYFPELSERQRDQLSQLSTLYSTWNAKINVISRKDIDHVYLHHVLHSLGLAKVKSFSPGDTVLDIGTGGGFPGIPLAILFPETQFTLIDSIGKKIKVVQAVAEACGLQNVQAFHRNVKEDKRQYDYVVSRAVMNTADLVALIRKNVAHRHSDSGLYCLKGGDLDDELKDFAGTCKVWALSDYFDAPFFETKKVVYVHL